MARAHCDEVIKPFYVKVVCRILRNNNVNIQKNDVDSNKSEMKSIRKEK
jgi:hypothetical protein